jgi:hypothetical protein
MKPSTVMRALDDATLSELLLALTRRGLKGEVRPRTALAQIVVELEFPNSKGVVTFEGTYR